MARETGGFGRLVAPKDGRDFNFLMRSVMPQIRALTGKPKPRKRAYTEAKERLNQGNKPHCVSFSGKGNMLAAPLMSDPGYETTVIYNECQRHDEWPGENYDGTSVRALMKVLSDRGWISGYVWGQTVEEATAWMNGGYGTIIIGTNWYASMDDIGEDGFIKLPGSMATPVGGHAYRVNWYDAKKNGYLVINSWGYQWGIPRRTGDHTGTAYLRREDFERLLHEEGEITAPTQVKVKPVQI